MGPSFGAASAFSGQMRVNVYIDGFNLYYAAVRGTPYKWLDLRALCEASLPNHTVNRIKYFTARVKARPHDPDQPARQDAYLRALQSLPGFHIYYGTFRDRTKRAMIARGNNHAGSTVEVLVTEEKGSDVNLATELLIDGFRNDYEAAVVISDDSDLLAPVRAVRQVLGLRVAILNPHPAIDPRTGRRRFRKELARAVQAGRRETMWFYEHLDRTLLPLCQLPDPVIDRDGRRIHKPNGW